MKRLAFRRAWRVSIALHAAGAGVLLLVLHLTQVKIPSRPGIDTRAADEPQVRISFCDTAAVRVAFAPPADPRNEARQQSPPPAIAPLQPSRLPGPITTPIPQTLLPELTALIAKPSADSTSATADAAANAVPAAPGMSLIRPASGSTAPIPDRTPAASAAPAIHGALSPGTTVVYVLDCSGSMGGAGKFDRARAALSATLREQPPTVRFQVIVYSGSATPLLATNGTALAATEANVRTAVARLAPLEARGRSNHRAAIAAAVAFRPDVILLLTDAEDLSAAALAPILGSGSKAVPLRLGQVTAVGVQAPRVVK